MNQTIKLDTRKCDGAYGKARIATLRRGERNNALLTVKVCANGQPYDLAGKTVSLVATTAAGKLVGPCPMEVAEAGIARIMLPAALYSAVGSFRGYVEIRDGDTLVDTTDRFGGKVIECADLDSEQAAEFTPLLGELQNAVAEEAKRVEAEKARAQAETERVKAEEERGKAEEKRAQDSKTRLEELAQAKTNAETATGEANTARNEAKKAANDATSAAGKATDAAGLAETAKTNANTAAEEAKSAATKAEAAARKADGAAEAAGTAASTAERAANKADTAAGNADSMAEKADASANKADIAAGKANEATVAATNAATKANEVEAKLTGNVLKGKAKETFVHVDDAFPSTLLGIEIEGATKQVTTIGAQLIDPDGIDTTVGGLNIVRNADGSITVNKTATGYVWYMHDSNIVLEAGTYTISGATDKVSVFVTRISDGGTIGSQTSSVKSTFTVTETETAKIMIRLGAGNYNNYFVYPMLQYGSVATAYEPYTGGKPSPSPDYPQEIKVIENPVVKVQGRNLLKVNNTKVTARGVTLESKDGIFTLTGTATENGYSGLISNFLPLDMLIGKPVIMKVHAISGNVPTIVVLSSDYKWIRSFDGKNNVLKTSVKYVTASCVAGTTYDCEFYLSVEAYDTDVSYYPSVYQQQAFTLPAEHPYLAKLPDGTADEIVVDGDGNVELVVRVSKATIDASLFSDSGKGKMAYNFPSDGRFSSAYFKEKSAISQILKYENAEKIYRGTAIGISVGSPFLSEKACNTILYIGDNVDTSIIDGSSFYYPLMTEKRYSLGKIEMPKAQDSISNVWADAEVTPRTGIEYTRDVNIVVANLESAIASIS